MSDPSLDRVLQRLEDSCETVAIFGGFARDLLRSHASEFRSDIDVIVGGSPSPDLAEILSGFSIRRNRFGGFRIEETTPSLDVWRIQDTWAFKSGAVVESGGLDVRVTTFFDWDSVLFDLKSQTLVVDSRVEEAIERNVVGLNLETNPDPAGMVINIARMVIGRKARIAPGLVKYFKDQIEVLGTDRVLDQARRSKKAVSVTAGRLDYLSGLMEDHLREHPECAFPLASQQETLRFE